MTPQEYLQNQLPKTIADIMTHAIKGTAFDDETLETRVSEVLHFAFTQFQTEAPGEIIPPPQSTANTEYLREKSMELLNTMLREAFTAAKEKREHLDPATDDEVSRFVNALLTVARENAIASMNIQIGKLQMQIARAFYGAGANPSQEFNANPEGLDPS